MHVCDCRAGGHLNEGRIMMRRFAVVLSIVAAMFLGGLALQVQPVTVAQDATPAAGPVGVTASLLGRGETTIAPGH